MESEFVNILRDFMIQFDGEIVYRKPDIMVIEKQSNKCFISDVANSGDHNLMKKVEKLEKYGELYMEVAGMWNKETVVTSRVNPKGSTQSCKQIRNCVQAWYIATLCYWEQQIFLREVLAMRGEGL